MADGGFQVDTLNSLAAVPRWVAWQIEDRNGKPTKMPYRADGRRAKANSPPTWCDRAAATERLPLLPRPYGRGGIGIMLGEHHGLTIGGLDLDTCIAETGDLAPWAVEIMRRFPSYAETSPSGTGLKVFFTYNGADLPALRAVMGTADWSKLFKRRTGTDHPPSIEVHLGNRFFTVTDQQHGAISTLHHVSTDTLVWLIQEAGPAFVQKQETSQPGTRSRRKAQRAEREGGNDGSRSGIAFGIACGVVRDGGTYADMLAALAAHPHTAAWLAEKGMPNGEREAKRTWENANKVATPRAAWLRKCQTAAYGAPRGNLQNVLLALREDDELKGTFRRDEMLCATVVKECAGAGTLVAATDVHIGQLQEMLQRAGLETVGKDTVHQAVDIVAAENGFHPVRAYLDALRWDGKPRLRTWLHRYLGAEASEYTSGIGTMFLVAMEAVAQ